MFRKHRNLVFGVAFAAVTVWAWTAAHRAYTRSIGMVRWGESSHHINLEHVAQHLAANPGQTLEQWLGPTGSEVAVRQRWQYRGRCVAALLCGFMAVFCAGTYLDERQRAGNGSRRDNEALNRSPTQSQAPA